MELTEHQKLALYKIVTGLKEKKLPIQTLGGFAGTGKAQPLHSLIATPTGFVTMGELKIEDEVCTPSGRIAKVNGIFPQGLKPIYRVWFSDGHSVDCCDDHLWKVIDRRRLSNLNKYKTPHKVFPLSYIREHLHQSDGKNRFYVETAEAVEFEAQDINIDPYLLGVLLGDGSIGSNNFAIHTEDLEIKEACDSLLKKWSCHLEHKEEVTYSIVGNLGRGPFSDSVELRNELRKIELWDTKSETKFIPYSYLRNEKSIRWALLQGLMDTDGTVDYRTGMASITTTSPRLAADICYLVESLGGICRINPKNPKCHYKGQIILGQDAFVLNIGMNNTPDLFRLTRKKELAKVRTKYKTRRCIRSIEYVGHEEAQCIMIDDPDHLYLTDHFVPTHNTTLIKYLIKFFPNFGVAAYTGKAANVLRKKGIAATTIHSRIYKPYFDVNGSLYWDLTQDPGCDGFIIDEASMVSQEIYDDLVSFGLPLVFVGDHGQLEPVDSKFNLMEKPDYCLEEIHRNAGDIAKFAEHLRNGFAARGFKSETNNVEFVHGYKLSDNLLMEVDQVICAFNKTRVGVNDQIRRAKGFTDLVNVGERIMCLRNNRKAGLFNGMQGTVLKLYEGKHGRKMMDFQFDEILFEGLWYDPSNFGQESYKIKHGDTANPFDYAHCITCHKSQGDEFKSVLVIEQKCKNWSHKRWAYTSASRAKEKLYWKPGN